jgi:hypothetical protein
MVALIRCFLHAWLKIRDRAKNLKELFFEMGERVWEVYYSPTRRMMSQRIRRLSDWAKKNLSGIVLAKVLDLCDKEKESRDVQERIFYFFPHPTALRNV